jgi:hypothetical protein
MLEEPANTETLVPHVYEIIQNHGQKACNIKIQLLWEPHVITLLLCLAYRIQKLSFSF